MLEGNVVALVSDHHPILSASAYPAGDLAMGIKPTGSIVVGAFVRFRLYTLLLGHKLRLRQAHPFEFS
jgi:hypothetical protein